MRRKLAVILSSDVAGYSRLVAENEESTLVRFAKIKQAFTELVNSFHGRVFNTAGDAILAEFQSATEAVRCAIEIQETVRLRNAAFPENQRIVFRIGIAVGDVLMQEEDGDLLGDGVNVAARLQTLAQPGGICISDEVYAHVGRNLSVTVSDMGNQALKNIPNPVRVYGIGAPGPADGGETPSQPAQAKVPSNLAASKVPLLAGVAVGAILVGGLALWFAAGRTTPPSPAPNPVPAVQPQAAAAVPAVPVLPPPATPSTPAPAQPASAPPAAVQAPAPAIAAAPANPAAATQPGEAVQATTATLIAALHAAGVTIRADILNASVERYMAAREQKAFFVAPNGGTFWISGQTTLREAETFASEACQVRTGQACRLLARDFLIPAANSPERLRLRPSARVEHEGAFDLARIPIVPAAALRNPDIVGYTAAPAPKAMAIHYSGRLAVGSGVDGASAETQALAVCNAATRAAGIDGPCFTYAIDNQVVLPHRRSEAR